MKSKRHTPEQVIKRLSEDDKLLNEGATGRLPKNGATHQLDQSTGAFQMKSKGV